MRFKCTLFVVFFFVFILGVSAIERPNDKYVNDFAGILTFEEINELRNLFYIVEQNTSAEVVFVSLQTCEGVPDQYAQQIFDSWEIGKEDKDNGLLILYCFEERKLWVSTGYGLEGILPDSKIGRILDEVYVPLRDSGEVQLGIINISYEFSQILVDNVDEIYSVNENEYFIWAVIFFIFFVIIIITIVSSGFRGPRVGRSSGYTYSGSSSHRSSGSFSFGGGRSGGGGAGR